VLLITVLVVFVGQYLADQWDQLEDYTLAINWPALIASQVALSAGLAILGVANGYVLRYMGHPLPWLDVCRIFFISNIAKYLPGSIWALPGRMFLYQRAGIPTAVSVVAVFWEVLWLLVTAAVTTLLGWRFLDYYLPTWVLIIGTIGGLLLLVAILAVVQSGNLQERVLKLPMPARARAALARRDLWLSLPQTLAVMGWFFVGWLVIGVSFSGMVYAVVPDFETIWWIELGGLYMGTWVVGFLVFFTPGGIGVRDVLIGLGISIILGDPLPAVIAILARITWTLAEVSNLLISVGLTLLINRGKSPDTEAA